MEIGVIKEILNGQLVMCQRSGQVLELMTGKHGFTILIIFLYLIQSIYQAVIHQDYTFGWYWFSACQITVASMLLSNRG